MKYRQRDDGERYRIGSTHKVMCCDCGLVHVLRYRRYKGKLYATAWRMTKATAAARRGKKYAGLKLPKK